MSLHVSIILIIKYFNNWWIVMLHVENNWHSHKKQNAYMYIFFSFWETIDQISKLNISEFWWLRNPFKRCSAHIYSTCQLRAIRAAARQSADSIGVPCEHVFEVIWSHASREYRFASSVIGSYTPRSAKANNLLVLVSANTIRPSYHRDLRRIRSIRITASPCPVYLVPET